MFLPSDRPAYDAASAVVMATLRSFPVVVEVWGWDEAFVGARTDDPEAAGPGPAGDGCSAETRLSCAVGIGETKLQAKTATGFAKPGGVARLTRATWIATMGDRPVTAVWGIGARTAQRLEEAGIRTVVELARADHDDLARRFGPAIGPHLRILGLGGDDAPVVDEPHVARSRSQEETFTRDVTDPAEIADHVARLAVEVTGVRRRRGPAGDARRREGAHGHVLHPHQDQQAARADDRSGRGGADGRRGARPLRARSTRCACSASGWCSNSGVTSTIVAGVVSWSRRPPAPVAGGASRRRTSEAHWPGSCADVSISTSPRVSQRAPALVVRGHGSVEAVPAVPFAPASIDTSQDTRTIVRSAGRSARAAQLGDRRLPHHVLDHHVVAGRRHRRRRPVHAVQDPQRRRAGVRTPGHGAGGERDGPPRPAVVDGLGDVAHQRVRSAGPAGGAGRRPARTRRRHRRRPAWHGRCCSCRRSGRRRATPPTPADPRTHRKPTGRRRSRRYLISGSRGRPRMRSPIWLRLISDVPPAIDMARCHSTSDRRRSRRPRP